MLIQDVFELENLTILSENKAKRTMKVRGTFQRADEQNNNGRIYPKPLLEAQVKRLQPYISERRLCGELDHPENEEVRLTNASHLITSLSFADKEVIGEAELLNTPAGLTAQALINGGVKVGISSRGMGTLSENEDGSKTVNEDFKLVTFDLVADPSTRGAHPGLTESRNLKLSKDTQKKLRSEKVFLKLLEKKLAKAYPEIEQEFKLYTPSPVAPKIEEKKVFKRFSELKNAPVEEIEENKFKVARAHLQQFRASKN